MRSPFRAIRQKLFSEGKLVRYLGYAVGEVILIIVGILFALKINDWNEARKAQAEFDEYIVQLREDVRQAIEYLDYTKEFMGSILDSGELVVGVLERTEFDQEDVATFEDALNTSS